MLYIINILFGCFYLHFVRIDKLSELWKVIPIVLLWTIIAGGQYNVGADYPLYFSYFNHYFGVPNSRFEWLFAAVTDATIKLGFLGQGPFFVFSFINIVLIFVAGKIANIRHWGIYYLLIITVATVFNNQLNAVRQTIAVCLCFIAFLEFYERKWIGILLILLGMGFHTSVILCLPFFFLKRITDFTAKCPIMLLIISFVSAFIDSATGDFNNYLLQIMPDYLKENTHYAEAYEDSEYSHSTSFIYRAAKLILIPLYWKSLMLIKRNCLTKYEQNLFNLGFFAFMMRNLLLLNTLTGRISYYFWIPSIFPLYYLMRYYWQRKEYLPYIIIVAWLVVPYITKIIVGTQNYADRFIYFN